MIPTKSEFLLLYFSYLGTFLFFAFKFFITKKKSFLLNLFLFCIYTAFMIYIFSDKENFKYGNSLAVLLYGGLFLLTHLIIYGFLELIKNIKVKLNENTMML